MLTNFSDSLKPPDNSANLPICEVFALLTGGNFACYVIDKDQIQYSHRNIALRDRCQLTRGT